MFHISTLSAPNDCPFERNVFYDMRIMSKTCCALSSLHKQKKKFVVRP